MIICSSALVYVDARHEVDELFDASLVQTARVLNGLLTLEGVSKNKQHLLDSLQKRDADLSDYSNEATPEGHKYEKKLFFQIWSEDQRLILKSTGIHSVPPVIFEKGFRNEIIDGHHWRTFTLFSANDPYWLIVGERDDIRGELVHNIATNHSAPLLIFVPIFAISVWLLMHVGFKPLQLLVRHVRDQDYNSLEASAAQDMPSEIIELKKALNQLFSRLNVAYQRENRFASDAAHEFKNPLASLVIHIDDLLESADNPEWQESLLNAKQSAKQLTHLVDQLLALSRAEALLEGDTTVNVQGLCFECFDQVEISAKEKGQALSLQIDEAPIIGELGYQVLGDELLLARIITNLLDNAIRYTPAGGEIQLQCLLEDSAPVIVIEDSGPGIPFELHGKIFERFYRVSGSGEAGSGLGLAIVKQGAEYHRAALTLDSSALGGLKVTLKFPVVEHKLEGRGAPV